MCGPFGLSMCIRASTRYKWLSKGFLVYDLRNIARYWLINLRPIPLAKSADETFRANKSRFASITYVPEARHYVSATSLVDMTWRQPNHLTGPSRESRWSGSSYIPNSPRHFANCKTVEKCCTLLHYCRRFDHY